MIGSGCVVARRPVGIVNFSPLGGSVVLQHNAIVVLPPVCATCHSCQTFFFFTEDDEEIKCHNRIAQSTESKCTKTDSRNLQ